MQESRDNNLSGWLFCAAILVTVGLAGCAKGMYGILVTGENTQRWLNDAGSVTYEETFVGPAALRYNIAEIAFGWSLILLSFIAPRAMDARARRSSFLALPLWQSGLLIGSLILLAFSHLFLVLERSRVSPVKARCSVRCATPMAVAGSSWLPARKLRQAVKPLPKGRSTRTTLRPLGSTSEC